MATPFHYLNYVEGVQTDISPFLVPENALSLQLNCTTSYRLGTIMKRLGYERVQGVLESGNSITGLFHFRQTATTVETLATVNDATDDDTQLFYRTTGAWAPIAGAETAWANVANAAVEMEAFIGYCFFVGYNATDGFLPVASLTNTTTFSTATNVTSMPQAKFIKRYRDRLYVFNCRTGGTNYPFRFYYSSVPSAGAITWTVASDFLDVDYSEEGMGMGENWDRLVLFTEYSAYFYNQVEFKKVWDVGCSAHRTIKNAGAQMLWANRDGVWRSTGGRPENIAGRVIDFIRFGTPTNFFAEIVDEEYYLHVGDVTVNGISYTNTVLVWSIPTETWRVHSYANTFTIFGKVFSSGHDFLYIGLSNGTVHVHSKYTDATPIYSDGQVGATLGTAIASWFQTGALTLGNPAQRKKIEKIIAYSDRAQSLRLKASVIDDNTMAKREFHKLGELRKYINEFPCTPDKGHLLQIEGTENSTNPYWSLFGFTIYVDPEGQTKP